LGADVPFFIFDTPFAVARGVGDRLKKINIGKKLYHILVYPDLKVATKGIYRALDASVARQKPGLTKQSGSLTNRQGGDKIGFPKNWDGLEELLHNDLEAVVVAKNPVVGKTIRCLVSSLGRRVVVSGSGPSVFCLCGTRKEAVRARERLFRSVPARLRKRWQVFIVETKDMN